MTTPAQTTPKLALSLPLKIWKRAGVSGILYLGVVVVAVVALRHYVHKYASLELSSFLDEVKLRTNTVDLILQALNFLLWLPVAPIVLTAFLIPIRLVWIFGRIDIGMALAQTGEAFKTTGIMLNLTFRQLLLLMAPVFAMYFFYRHMLTQGQNEHFMRIYIVACMVVALPILWRAIPIVGALFIAVLSRCSPYYAFEQSNFILEGKSVILMMLMALAGVFMLASAQASWQLPPGSYQYFASIAATLAAASYCITGVAIICLNSAQEYARRVSAMNFPQSMNNPYYTGDLVR